MADAPALGGSCLLRATYPKSSSSLLLERARLRLLLLPPRERDRERERLLRRLRRLRSLDLPRAQRRLNIFEHI